MSAGRGYRLREGTKPIEVKNGLPVSSKPAASAG
jgi:hypothetical protein